MLLIQNGRVVDPFTQKDEMLDVLIKDHRIEKVAPFHEMNCYINEMQYELENMQQINAEGQIICPGFMDVHVHFRDPGFTYKEDIETGANAAIAGGFTSVVLMANTKPCVDNAETLQYILEKGAKTKLHIMTCATISKGLQGKELVDMKELKSCGAVGFTDDGIPLLEEEFARKAMEMAKEVNLPLSFHEENPAFITNNGINRGEASAYYQIGGSDRQAEIQMIERDIALALETGAVINIQHISTKEGVELVRQAKHKGTNIHAEATPHHFSLTEEAVMLHGSLAKMNPPLRTKEDLEAIILGLEDGTIDIIATDHAPHATYEKEKPITEAPSGIIGLETAFPLAITNLVKTGRMTLMQVLERMVTGPAALYGIPCDAILEGKPANLVIFDENVPFQYEKSYSKSTNSPFFGDTLYGKISKTLIDGQVVYETR